MKTHTSAFRSTNNTQHKNENEPRQHTRSEWSVFVDHFVPLPCWSLDSDSTVIFNHCRCIVYCYTETCSRYISIGRLHAVPREAMLLKAFSETPEAPDSSFQFQPVLGTSPTGPVTLARAQIVTKLH